MSGEVSEFFESAFLGCGCGTPVAECSCGRTTYSDSDHYDTGEREALDRRNASHPDRVLYIEDDAVSVYVVWGAEVVVGCPCKALSRLEKSIWDNRKQITKYLTSRAKAQASDANAILSEILGNGEG